MRDDLSSNADLALQQLCSAAIREKDPLKRSQLIEEIDHRLDEDHKRSSLQTLTASARCLSTDSKITFVVTVLVRGLRERLANAMVSLMVLLGIAIT